MAARLLALAVALASPALAGCLSGSAPTPLGLSPPALPQAYRYACPGEADAQADPCFGSIMKADATQQEPFAAAHPTDPRTFAIGVNYGPSQAERAQRQGEGDVCRLHAYVTRDGGVTWTESIVPTPMDLGPAPALALPCAGDPAQAFDEHGRLHMSGIAAPSRIDEVPQDYLAYLGVGEATHGYRTFYVRSDDGGQSWGEPVWLRADGHDQDRNWLTRDPATGAIYVIWQNVVGPLPTWTTEIAWSNDGGQTWKTQQAEQRAPCHTDGPVVVRGTEVLFSCSNSTAESAERVRIYAFDPATGNSTLRGELPQLGYWPLLSVFPDGRLAMVYEPFQSDNQLVFSGDGGRTWERPTSLLALANGSWQRGHVYWAEADPWGGYHLLALLERDGGIGPLPGIGPPIETRYEIRHLVLDAWGHNLQETTLQTWKNTDPATVRPVLPLGDHFYGIAFGQAGGLLAFTHDGTIRTALTVPAMVMPAIASNTTV